MINMHEVLRVMALLEKFWLISPDNTEQINVNINKWENEWEEKEKPSNFNL